MRRSIFAAKDLRGSGYPPAQPTFAHTAYGQFQITNYNSVYRYVITVTNGTTSGPDASGFITLSGTDAIATVTPYFGPSGPSGTVERKAYTYYYGSATSCADNCMPNGGPGGPNTCWCGSLNPQGDLCCGGCYGQTCTTYQTGPFKNATPSGYSDSYSEWWKTS